MLPLLGGLAHGVNETNLRFWKSVSQNANQLPDLIDRLRRLRRDSEPRTFAKLENIGLGQDYVEIRQIFCHPTHFDVIALADDDRMKTIAHERSNRTMREMHERARGFQYAESTVPDECQRFFRSAVGRNHDVLGFDACSVSGDLDAAGTQGGQDGFVVDQFPQDGQRLVAGLFEGKIDGVADAEAHAEVGGAEDAHALHCKVIVFAMQSICSGPHLPRLGAVVASSLR
jgi:hypothetical protein